MPAEPADLELRDAGALGPAAGATRFARVRRAGGGDYGLRPRQRALPRAGLEVVSLFSGVFVFLSCEFV